MQNYKQRSTERAVKLQIGSSVIRCALPRSGGTIWWMLTEQNAGRLIALVNKHVNGKYYCVTSQTWAIPDHIRGGLLRCAIQIDIYFTLLYFTETVKSKTIQEMCNGSDNSVLKQKEAKMLENLETFLNCQQRSRLWKCVQTITQTNCIVLQGLTSHSTHYRSFRGRFYRSDDPTNSVIALKDDRVKGQSHGLSTLKGKEKNAIKYFSTYSAKYIEDTEKTHLAGAFHSWQLSCVLPLHCPRK